MKRQPMPAAQPIVPLRTGNGAHLHDGGPEVGEPSTPRSMARPGRTKAHVLLGGSALIAAATALTVLLLLSQLKERAESEAARRVTVVMAARDLPVGTPLEADDLRIALLDPENVNSNAIFSDAETLIGRVPRQVVLQGDFLREERLASPGTSGGLNALLQPSKRAMAIEADSAAGVAGYLEPGNFVDVIVTIRPDEKIAGSARWATDTILEGVKVLALGTARDPEASAEDQERARKSESRRRRTLVTVEVTSEEAEKLALGSSRGELHLVLRGDLDVATTSDGEPVVANDLVGKKPRAYRQRSSGPSAVVIAGDSTTIEQFSNGQRIIRSSSNRR